MKNITLPCLLLLVFLTHLIGWMAQRIHAKLQLQPPTLTTEVQHHHTPMITSKLPSLQHTKPRLFVALHQCKVVHKHHRNTGVWHPCQQPRKRIFA